MKLPTDMKINGKYYSKGSDISAFKIYPFFLFHMLSFGSFSVAMAYATDDVPLEALYLFGGFAILVYLLLYLKIFGLDEVKWMFINAGIGAFGIYLNIDWMLSYIGKGFNDFPLSVHAIPFMFYVLYTFLIRQALIDIANARENPARREFVENAYIVIFVLLYLYLM